MARITNNPLLQGAKGMVGGTLVIRQVHNLGIILSNRPKKRKQLSERQKEQVLRFQEAGQYASLQMKDPEAKAAYAKGIDGKKSNARLVALADYLNPPVVHSIKAPAYTGAVGETITIKATDDFKVTEVQVTIRSASGGKLEQGQAERYRIKANTWKYKTTVLNPDPKGTTIQAVAYDRPGNKTRAEIVL